MEKINIDGLQLTQPIVDELKKWYDGVESTPETYVDCIEQIKDTLIRLMCEENEKYDKSIKESLVGLMMIQDSLKQLIPPRHDND